MSAEKEYRVDEVFRKGGETYLCVIDDSDGDVACKRCEIKHFCWDGMECKAEDRSDNTGVHFVRVSEPKEGMMFRASDGKLYELRNREAGGCFCYLHPALDCLDIDKEAFGKGFSNNLHWYPVEESKEKQEEKTKMEEEEHQTRHIELAVVKVEGGKVTFRVVEQTHRNMDFCRAGDWFVAGNGISLVSGKCPDEKFDRSNKAVLLRGVMHDFDDTEITVTLEEFAAIMQAVSEYNETDGKGYEKQWPKGGDKYYYVGPFGEIIERIYLDDIFEEPRKTFGNFFRTREEAEAALERVKKALKGIDENKLLREALEEAVAMYGKPGGPWNVPGDAGGWISKARKALEVGNE